MKIIKNKKVVITLLVLLVVLVMLIFITDKIEKDNNKKIELATSIYEEIHNLYYYGGNIEYANDLNNNRLVTKINDENYYEISNFDVIKNLISKNMLSKTFEALKIISNNNKYYIKDIGRGTSNYYGTILKIKKIRKNKIEYKAMTKMCRKESIVSYGDRCTTDGYYEIEKPFIIVKEDNKWKVIEYTSIFQFSDRELK